MKVVRKAVDFLLVNLMLYHQGQIEFSGFTAAKVASGADEMIKPNPIIEDNQKQRSEALLGKLPDASACHNPLDSMEVTKELQETRVMLRNTRNYFVELFDQAPVGYVILDASGMVLESNATWQRMLNRPEENLASQRFTDLLLDEDVPVFQARIRSFYEDSIQDCFVVRVKRNPSKYFHARIEFRLNTFSQKSDLTDAAPDCMLIVTDISELEIAMHQIGDRQPQVKQLNVREERLDTLLRVIRSVNQISSRENDRRQLIQRVCENLAENLSYYNVWIALQDDSGQITHAVSNSGFAGRFEKIRLRILSGSFPGCMQQALVADQVIFTNDPIECCKESALAEMYEGRTGLSRRLSYDGKIFGVLTASVPSAYARDPDEQRFFEEIACDLAFALHKITVDQSLFEVNNRFRYFIENANDMIFSISMDGRFTYISPNWLDFIGEPPSEAMGKSYQEYVHPDDLQSCKEYIIRITSTVDKISNVEFRVQHRSGEWRWYVASGSPLRDSNGVISGIIGIARDVTSSKRIETSLRESERFLRTILDTTVDGFWVLDDRGRIVEVNEAYCKMSGYGHDELVGLMIQQIDSNATHEESECWIARVRLNGSHTFETQHRRKDQSIFFVEISATFLSEPDVRIVCFCRDLTDRKQREERIALLGQMLDNAPASITIHNPEGCFVYANRQTYRLHGYEDETTFLSINLHDLDAPESEALLAERFRLIAETGMARFEVMHRHKEGYLFPLEVLAKTIQWHDKPAILSIAADITDRKQVEEALRKSEERNRLLSDVTIEGILIHKQGIAIDVNASMARMLGKTIAELLGRNFLDFVHEDDRSITIENMAKESVLPYTIQINREDGTSFFAEIESRNFPGKDEIWRVSAIRDITKRKQAEDALRQSEENYRLLVETANEGIWSMDADHKTIYINQAMADMLGYEPCDIIGKHVETFFFAEDLPRHEQQMRNRHAGKDETYERRFKRRDGSLLWTLVSARSLTDSKGKFAGSFAMFTDITERKLTEDELRRRENQLQRIFEILPIGLWFADKDGTLLRGNPAGVRIWGAEPHVPMSDYGVFKAWRLPSREPIAPDEWALVKTIREGVTITDELIEIESFDGKRKTILNYTAPLMDDEQVTGAIVVNLDISDRKVLEDQLRQSQKMESIGRLAGGVAHDFNNMLGAILGNAELALENLKIEDPLHDYILEIIDAANRSTDVTRQLLAFARKQTIAPRMIDLNETIEGILKMLRRVIGENINLAWMPGRDVWPIRMDPSQIDQILANLCVNARDAINGFGTVTIRTNIVSIEPSYCIENSDFVPGMYVLLDVQDDGCGMDEKTIEHLFEPFFTTKAMGKGTGLGLATVYGIIKQNRGAVRVDSQMDRGTTFRIYLPACCPGKYAAGNEKADVIPPVEGTETILLVEDEPAILKMTTMMLNRLGYHVVTANTPGRAMALACEQSRELHLLMTDVVMPEMNGRDLARSLLTLHPNMKCLFMSGYTADVIAYQGVLEDGVQFIQKPFGLKDLATAVRCALAKDEPAAG